jgi:hypothetical protein
MCKSPTQLNQQTSIKIHPLKIKPSKVAKCPAIDHKNIERNPTVNSVVL